MWEDHTNAFQGIEVPSLVQKQAGLIKITKKENIFSNFFVNLEFLFVAPKNEKNHFRKAEGKVFYYILKII